MNPSTSEGKTGIIRPSARTSSATVQKMKARARLVCISGSLVCRSVFYNKGRQGVCDGDEGDGERPSDAAGCPQSVERAGRRVPRGLSADDGDQRQSRLPVLRRLARRTQLVLLAPSGECHVGA